MQADAYFDEDQNLDTAEIPPFVDTPFKNRDRLYEWATKDTTNAVIAEPKCPTGILDANCVMPSMNAAMQKWHNQVIEAGKDPADHPEGKSIPAWLRFSNDVGKRPTSTTRPSHFDTDDSAYKVRSKVTVSYIKTSNGKIVDGSVDAEYDARTADTHLPDFVRDTFAAIEDDYGIQAPNLTYTTEDLNQHNGERTTTDTSATGVLPGRAYQGVGKAPEITDDGTCVKVLYTSGGSIGYRPMLDTEVPGRVAEWRSRVANDAAVNSKVDKVAGEIYNAFFKSDPNGSIFNDASPIWQELNFRSCADGTIRQSEPGHNVLVSSYMPSQYLWRNGKAMGLDGKARNSTKAVIDGDFRTFSDPTKANGHCKRTSRDGNPWGLSTFDAGANPSGHFCVDSTLDPDPEYSD